MRDLVKRFLNVFLTILPVIVIVLIIDLLIVPGDSSQLGRFLLSSGFVWIGLTLFLIGIDLAIAPLGEELGKRIARTKTIAIVIVASMVLGFMINIAEPDLFIVASQVDSLTLSDISLWYIIISVSVAIGIFFAAAIFRILFRIPLYLFYIIAYFVIMVMFFLVRRDLVLIPFDLAGATTGAISVPFMLAIVLGIASMQKSGKSAEKDSFGLIGIASAGAIIGVMILILVLQPETLGTTFTETSTHADFGGTALKASLSLLPMFLILILGNSLFFKFRWQRLRRFIFGFFYTYIGLLLFLYGVDSGFFAIGRQIGMNLVFVDSAISLAIGFVLGFLAILAEPAVYILTNRIREVTSGYVSRLLVVVFLAGGVGLALSINVLRLVVVGFPLWYVILPGYILALVFMFFTPKMFIGIAFDSGGVASGPIAATFILAFFQGLAVKPGNILLFEDAFGMIALIALIPILMIEMLGIIYKTKNKAEVR